MEQLSEAEVEFISRCLKEGRPLPDSYRYIIPFETKKEYELTYADKEREEDILADTMMVPLQPVKTFGNNGNGWTNKLIFGDNLQVLKTLMNDPEVKGKVRLIYIDPPFATRQEFRGSQDQKAYQDKIAGSEFMEFLRKRLIFLREILADDGTIYVHLDYRTLHYIKLLMDEIFGKERLINEAVYSYRIQGISQSSWARKHQTLLFYAKTPNYLFKPEKEIVYYEKPFIDTKKDEKGRYYNDVFVRDVWDCDYTKPFISGSKEYIGYRTQKSEGLLKRIIEASTEEGDLVLDAFAGSGTAGAVAEKLGRRWIMIDCGKLAIYTMQKRLLNLREEIGNKGKPLKAKPFTLCNAGLYDYRMIKELPWEEYRAFVLKLFQCRDERHRIAGLELDGYLGADDVLVFNYKKYEDAVLDRGFIDDLHSILGDRVGRRFFIVAPAASVMFLEDYIERGNTRYFVLRIPYSIIDELHRKGFTHIKQPVSEMDVNDTVDAVGFDFIQIPEVECEYYLDKPRGQVGLGHSGKDAVIKINRFESNIISKKPVHFENFETLSMVMVDYDYNGEVFNFDDVFYAEDLKKQDYEIRFDSTKLDGQMMLIYIDIFGNEKREVKKLGDF
jgi:site-specific DNA-methyltransferase (adenine-specific)/adenine-specific DNA-methyltransferase